MAQRIFVSHVNGCPDTEAVLDGLCGALRGAGLDVLVDTERLALGMSWRNEIYGWLGLCHAAVVLISRRAVEDPAKFWVARETTLLIWRRALDPSLQILPVLLPGVAPDDLASGRFADLQLPELQYLRDAPDAQAVVDHVLLALRQAPRQASVTPLEALAGQVAARLGGIAPEGLEAAADALAFDFGPWRPAADPRRELALALLCAPLDDSARALELMADYGGRAARADLADVARTLGANWVDPEAARWLATEAPQGRAALLNASTQFAAECYVQRACGRAPPGRWPVVPLTGVTGEETAAELRAEIDAALERALPLPPDAFGPSPAERRRRLLARWKRQGLATFLLARLPPDPPAFLAALAAACPDAVPFLLGDDIAEEDADRVAGSARLLRPMLAPGADLDARTRMDDLLLRLAEGG